MEIFHARDTTRARTCATTCAAKALAIVELALPAMRQSPPEHQAKLQACLLAIATADRCLSVFEWSLLAIVRHQLLPPDERARTVYRICRSFAPLRVELVSLLGIFCRASGMDPDRQQKALNAALSSLALAPAPLPKRLDLNALHHAILACGPLIPTRKRELLAACCECAAHDGHVSASEAQALRAVATMLDCPIPPLAKWPSSAV